MSNTDALHASIQSLPDEHYSSRGEIVEHYQDTFGASWRSHIVDDLVKQTGMSRSNVAREFQYDKRSGQERYKGTRVSAGTAAKYQKLGLTLPAKGKRIPPGGFTVTVKGKVDPSPKKKKGGRSQPRERDFEYHFSGVDAVEFANNPSLEQFFESYGVDGETFAGSLEDGASISISY